MKIREIEAGEHLVCANIYANAWNVALPNATRTMNVDEFESEVKGEQSHEVGISGIQDHNH